MRLRRSHVVPVLAIMAGGVIGASLSFSFLERSRSDDVPALAFAPVVAPVPPVAPRAPVPPSPLGLIIPSEASLRGTVVQVRVFVDERGRVVSDSTRLEPPTRDLNFNQRLIRQAEDWVFAPAQNLGNAVASWFTYTVTPSR